jgi:superfamily II DNA/RNA helicase
MERALNPDLIREALGQPSSLPSVEELSNLIAQAELASLLGKSQVDPSLIATAWYLHAVASSKYAFRVFGRDRQRSAFKVSGHIFDIAAKNPELSQMKKLEYCFASQIAYLRSELDPNAIAIYNREAKAKLIDVSLFEEFSAVSLCCGVAFLGFDTKYIYDTTDQILQEIRQIATEWDIADVFDLPCGSSAGVALGARDLMTFLVYGGQDKLARARETLLKAVLSEPSGGDQLSRWIAAHLLNLSDDLEKHSVRSVLPPDTNPGLVRAFALGQPRVLTLWPPQIELLKPDQEGEKSPLSHEVKRLFLSTPTSSGKTLLAQILIASHLSTQQTSVYYIAPTRSLCREVKLSLQKRLRFMGKQILDGLPEGVPEEDLFLEDLFPDEPKVEVMTPERLSYLLRTDSGKVLSEVGLFVFDEVHNVDDKSRGWTLEQDLAYLHYATKGKDQRIALLSAAVGNQVHFVQWMEGKELNVKHREWRGPRRIHAIYTAEKDPQSRTAETLTSDKYSRRVTYLTSGELKVRLSQTGNIHPLPIPDNKGQLSFQENKHTNKWERNETPFYKMLVPLITFLANSGPVLTIMGTRQFTILMAKAIAESQLADYTEPIKVLLNLVEARLGNQHPLWNMIQKRVAYYHGSLPNEIRVAIEDAVVNGQIKYLVATTAMTEGVNLPVRSVVIAQQGAYTKKGYQEYIIGSKLINAIGRAGRATKETDGIVVLARKSDFSEEDFEKLTPKPEELTVFSMLATERALNELAALEETQRNLEDLVFELSEGTNSDFLSFIWFIAAELEKINSEFLTIEGISNVLSHTLGWVQLSDDNKTKWLKLAEAVLNRYKATDESSRRRWAASGTSISSARKREDVARSLANSAKKNAIPEAPVDLVKYILAEGRLNELLNLPEANKKAVYTKRSGKKGRPRPIVEISVDELLSDWMVGKELVDIANKHLAGVANVDYRFEQLGDLLNQYFEVFFPWVLGTLVSWANQFLTADGIKSQFSQAVPAYVRWGVGTVPAVELMSKGLASRTLATRIANAWLSANTEFNLMSWLRSLSLTEWQESFSATAMELRLLLEFCRDQKSGAAAELITNEKALIKVETSLFELPMSAAKIERIDQSAEFSHFGIWVDENLVGKIGTKDHAEMQEIKSLGLAYSATFSVKDGDGFLHLALLPPKE